jgi:flavin-dependent dehydrogenase
MKHYQVIIVGGGPAGSTCAGKLVKTGVNCLVLEKDIFPRQKTCAGWITPRVFTDIGVNPDDYPYELTEFPRLKIYINGFPIIRPGKQYAIRRIEFDDWLLNRSRAKFIPHQVKRIWLTDQGYCIDGLYTAEYLIGAGGTHCPVYHTFFNEGEVRTGSRIVALEEEYLANWSDPSCRLWFFENNLPGYAWYVPKKSGYLNIGVGGNSIVFKQRGDTIQDQWDYLIRKLQEVRLIQRRSFKPRGHIYHLRGASRPIYREKIYLIGDSAGLATLDMGEGIGPAIRSGFLAAESILNSTSYSVASIPKYSLLPPGLRWFVR